MFMYVRATPLVGKTSLFACIPLQFLAGVSIDYLTIQTPKLNVVI